MSRTASAPLRAEDALFLHAQTPLLCQQVGAVVLLEHAAFSLGEFQAAIAQRVRGVPQLRRRLGVAPGRWRRPFWVADEDIDVTRRVREVVARDGGKPRTLGGVVDMFFSQRCDPCRMPWEILLIRGADEGTAIAVKVHHALGDSQTIIGALTQLFDEAEQAAALSAATAARRETGRGHAGGRAREAAREAARAIRGLAYLAAAGTAPHISVCGAFTSAGRRYVPIDFPARDVATTARGLDAGIGDLLLAMLGEAIGRLIRSRGEETDGRVLRVAMPRAQRARPGGFGPGAPRAPGGPRLNRTAAISLDVPIGPATPGQRLAAVRGQIFVHVHRGEDAAAALVLRAMNVLPQPLQRLVAAHLYQRRWFNVLFSVFPGIRRGHRLLGAPVARVYPVLALADGVGIAIGAMTWGRSFSVGILADAGLVPDADKLAAELAGAFELYQAAARTSGQDKIG